MSWARSRWIGLDGFGSHLARAMAPKGHLLEVAEEAVSEASRRGALTPSPPEWGRQSVLGMRCIDRGGVGSALCWHGLFALDTVDGRNPAPPKNDASPVKKTNKLTMGSNGLTSGAKRMLSNHSK